jgi:hypothetical protein
MVQLAPLYVYHGRTLLVLNDAPGGSHNVIVTAAPGETMFDGNTSVTVEPSNSLRITAG